MKRTALVLSVLTLNSGAALGQTSEGLVTQPVNASTRAELERARETIWRAFYAGDSALLERLIPPALAAGSTWSWEERAATIASAQRAAANGRRLAELHFDSTSITLRDSVAMMQARFICVTERRDGKRTTNQGTATEIFVRQDGRWVNPFWYIQ
jgi:SnoaL-like domain